MLKTIGDKSTYAVISSIGATVKEFVYRGKNLIYPERMVGEKSRGGIPICFPFFGKPIKALSSFPRHGWLRHQELESYWGAPNQVVFEGENEVTGEFPWRLKYLITISIAPLTGLLELKLVTERLLDGQYFSAPINPGFHPYFCSDFSKPPRHTIARCLARVGSSVLTNFEKESRIIIVDNPILIKSGGQTLNMELSGDFNSASQLTLWSDNADEYFCVEPILTHPSVFAEPEGGKFLSMGEKSEMVMRLTVV
jgi:galactose mutarotase-like enzyme